ncbi:MAG: CIA30 family protein [Pseudomonadota bacterium]
MLGVGGAAWVMISVILSSTSAQARTDTMLIDDFSNSSLTSQLGTQWRGVSDNVMGGISEAAISHAIDGEQGCLRLTGEVRLENNGGFVQAALNLMRDGGSFDAAEFRGIKLTVKGNDERYSLHLRTADNSRPWQSYRAHFVATGEPQTLQIPFSEFEAYRIETPLDISKLRRIGLVAIGRRFQADLHICQLEFYR